MRPAGGVGKKTKLAKGRLDTFYHLAKEHGFRSRASFKLIQLNKKYNFLDNASSLVDLCAAPGGWLQVAQKHMPLGSVIIGVDLQDIRPIRDVITFTDDITKQSCIRTIQGHLKNSKVDVVLHDGAPNMGTAWTQDAYSQVDLTLKATKCATLVLKKGGWFITKVFRSEDYNSLLWVFNQLFQKVEATKPMASRMASAEIYVVCRGFLAPSKIDPRLLDSKFVFKQDDEKKKVSINSITKGKKNREGYTTDGVLLFKKARVMDFLTCEDPVQFLAESNELVFDEETEKVLNHPKTTLHIKEALKDLKLLGKNEYKNVLKWRTAMRNDVMGQVDTKEKEIKEKEEIDALKAQQMTLSKREKRERKNELARKRKQAQKLTLRMAITGDKFAGEDELFNATSLKDVTNEDMENADPELLDDMENSDDEIQNALSSDSEDDSDEEGTLDRIERDMDASYKLFLTERNKRSRLVEKSKINKGEVKDKHHYEERDSDEEMLADDEEDDGVLLKASKKNPLILETATPKQRRVGMWYANGIFEGENFDDLDDAPPPKRKLETAEAPNKKAKTETANGKAANGKLANGDANGTAVNGTHPNGKEANGKKAKKSKPEMEKARKAAAKIDKGGFEVVAQESDLDSDEEREREQNFREGLNAEDDSSLDEADQESEEEDEINKKLETLGIATKMIRKKDRRALEDDMFSRYTFNDDDLPEWFTDNEAKYIKPNIPLTRADIIEMRQKYQEINARPIKKVAEALARKKRRTTLQTTKAKEKANAIAKDETLTPGQKISQVNKIMKKANQKQGTEKVYVVGKRGAGGTNKKRKHVKHARVRLVDTRMKKEARAHVRAEKAGRAKNNKKGGRKGGKGKGKKKGGKSDA